MLGAEQDEAQLVLGWGGGYKRGRETALRFWDWGRVRAEPWWDGGNGAAPAPEAAG